MPHDNFYGTTAWRRFRAIVLKQSPYCQVAGCPDRATHVDHIKTRRERPDLAFVFSNAQALCHRHHSAKTYRFDRPTFKKSARPLAAVGCDAAGVPLDPLHRWRTGSR